MTEVLVMSHKIAMGFGLLPVLLRQQVCKKHRWPKTFCCARLSMR
jgi:hypothetical protein